MDNSGLPFQHSGVVAPHVATRRLKACLAHLLKCPLCNGIYKEATTIYECMHTFCKECIYHKIQTEGIACCPTCNVDLSHLPPEDYLRPGETLRAVVNAYLGISQVKKKGKRQKLNLHLELLIPYLESADKQSKKPDESPKGPTVSEQASCWCSLRLSGNCN